jgi:hypothetical protein
MRQASPCGLTIFIVLSNSTVAESPFKRSITFVSRREGGAFVPQSVSSHPRVWCSLHAAALKHVDTLASIGAWVPFGRRLHNFLPLTLTHGDDARALSFSIIPYYCRMSRPRSSPVTDRYLWWPCVRRSAHLICPAADRASSGAPSPLQSSQISLPRQAHRWYATGYERSVNCLQHVGWTHRSGIRRMPSERRRR